MVENEPLHLDMNRKGFGMRAEVRQTVKDAYHSNIIEDIKSSAYEKTYGRFTVHLAQEFGFCYGVDRAVELAYEARQKFPNKKIYLTTEIIHNPTVNQDLLNKGISFLDGAYKNADFEDLKSDDVVLVPAFGTTIQELRRLHNTGCTLIDTICGSVIVVWKRVEKYAKLGFTSIIHGKYYHEETQATSSQVLQYKDGHYLIVLSKEEAQYVCDYILTGGNKEEFLEKFKWAMSPGFDPDLHLEKVGLANQTTMLSTESIEIGEMFKKTLLNKHIAEPINEHYMSFDTICSATQERQDAIQVLKTKKPDIMIVIGGYNSSNTAQLHKLALECCPSFHIDKPECIVDNMTILNKPQGQKEEIKTEGWLPKGNLAIGITAGASTPNSVMGDVLNRIINTDNN